MRPKASHQSETAVSTRLLANCVTQKKKCDRLRRSSTHQLLQGEPEEPATLTNHQVNDNPSPSAALNGGFISFVEGSISGAKCQDVEVGYNSVRNSQRQFVTHRLSLLRKMSPKLYGDCFVRPALQYFLATLCDLRINPDQRRRLGARYPQTPEVKKLLKKIAEEKPVSASDFQLNALLSALKEILGSFPGGIFVDISEEFYEISVSSRLQITVVYLHGLLEVLPYFLRQFVYLICRSLRNVVSQCSGTAVDSYTDLLLMFTPVLFPSSVGDVDKFLRAARLTLVMVDCCEQVFQPVVWLDLNGNVWQPLTDEESFFYQILASLGRLEETLYDESDEESTSNESMGIPGEVSVENGFKPIEPANQAFYQFAYLESNS